MKSRTVVSADQWVEARKQLLIKEKEFTRLRDALNRQRRELPWRTVDENYVFHGPDGKIRLAEAFDGRSQLIVYHFMFDPEWDAGCKSCSLLSDHFDPALPHLKQRDVSLVAISRAPVDKLEAFRQRMGWRFRWLSSHGNSFNADFGVSFTDEQIAESTVAYNYRENISFPVREAPGLSVFARDENGAVFHTYSTFARGLDMFIGTYNLLDVVPRGRDEDTLDHSMEWVRHHDRYDVPAISQP